MNGTHLCVLRSMMMMMEVLCEHVYPVVSRGWSLTGCSFKTEVGSGFLSGGIQTSIFSLLTMPFPTLRGPQRCERQSCVYLVLHNTTRADREDTLAAVRVHDVT